MSIAPDQQPCFTSVWNEAGTRCGHLVAMGPGSHLSLCVSRLPFGWEAEPDSMVVMKLKVCLNQY